MTSATTPIGVFVRLPIKVKTTLLPVGQRHGSRTIRLDADLVRTQRRDSVGQLQEVLARTHGNGGLLVTG